MSKSVYTEQEVLRHRSPRDLWVTDGQKVYDVTKFVGRHPGGPEVLLEHGGKDVSEWMDSRGPHKHSKAAYDILKKYCIGELASADKSKVTQNGENNNKNGYSMQNGQKTSAPSEEVDPRESIDMNKPMFWQVWKLGKYYQSWIHTPQDQDLRFFESDILESFTHCQWYMVPMVWVPLMFTFLYFSITNFIDAGSEIFMPSMFGGISLTVWHTPVIFLAGVLMWSFTEYVIHRWVFHLEPPHWSKVLITLHFLFHGQHHKNPMNKDRLVFPPVPALTFAIPIWYAYDAILPPAACQCIVAGTILGYMFYDLMHYYLHHGSPKVAYLKDLKNYHINHHYVEQNKGFGISSKLWDYPFATLITKDKDIKSR